MLPLLAGLEVTDLSMLPMCFSTVRLPWLVRVRQTSTWCLGNVIPYPPRILHLSFSASTHSVSTTEDFWFLEFAMLFPPVRSFTTLSAMLFSQDTPSQVSSCVNHHLPQHSEFIFQSHLWSLLLMLLEFLISRPLCILLSPQQNVHLPLHRRFSYNPYGNFANLSVFT